MVPTRLAGARSRARVGQTGEDELGELADPQGLPAGLLEPLFDLGDRRPEPGQLAVGPAPRLLESGPEVVDLLAQLDDLFQRRHAARGKAPHGGTAEPL